MVKKKKQTNLPPTLAEPSRRINSLALPRIPCGQLEDERTLESYNIQAGSKVLLVLRPFSSPQATKPATAASSKSLHTPILEAPLTEETKPAQTEGANYGLAISLFLCLGALVICGV